MIRRYEIESEVLRVTVLNLGGVVTEIYDKRIGRNLVVSYLDDSSYLDNDDHIGVCVTGPFSGRVRDGMIGDLELDTNFLGKHHLHGGNDPLGLMFFDVEIVSSGLVLSCVVNNINTGYNDLRLRVVVSLDYDSLEFEYFGDVDGRCLLNITNHSYFNFDLSKDILNHELEFSASHFFELDSEMLPVKMCDYEGSVFDGFKKFGEIDSSSKVFSDSIFVDHPFVLSKKEIVLSNNDVRMTINTTSDVLVIYTGNYMDLISERLNTKNRRFHGVCLECQDLPDAGNFEEFSACVWYDVDRPFYKCDKYRFEVSG